MRQIPNLFTLLNLVFGCLAIVYIFQNDDLFFSNRPGAFSFGLMVGSVFIFLAAVIDFLDGFVARLFNASSAMGAQLDSLADAVSFGVAPGMILFQMLQFAFTKNGGLMPSIWYLMPAIIIPCAAVWRLAKFNIDKEQTYYFKGVPTPAAALTVASFPFIVNDDTGRMAQWMQNPYFLYGAIFLLCIMMVSNIPLVSLKFKNFSIKNNMDKVILLLVTIVGIIFFKWAAVPLIFVAYVLVSLIFKPNKI